MSRVDSDSERDSTIKPGSPNVKERDDPGQVGFTPMAVGVPGRHIKIGKHKYIVISVDHVINVI